MPIGSWLVLVRRRLGLSLGLFCVAVGACLSWAFSPAQLPCEVIRVARSPDQILVGRLYTPPGAVAPYPTMMLWHGVNSTKEMLEPLAVELARHGVAALTVDSGGFGETYDRPFDEAENLADARAIAQYVFAHPERFEASKIGVGGHSMGAATALFLAMEDSRIQATVALGMSADIAPSSPANLLMGIGLYEQFHTPTMMREMLRQGVLPAERETATAGETYGDFRRGTARRLVISATSDHLMEPFDAALIRAAVDWTRQAFQLPPLTRPLMMPPVMVGWLLLLLGTFVATGCGLRHLKLLHPYPRWLLLGVAIAATVLLALGMMHALPSRLTTELLLMLAVTVPIGAYAVQYPANVPNTLRGIGLALLLLLLSFTTVAVLVRGDELLRQPGYLLGLPQFVAQIPTVLFYSRTYDFRGTMFAVYSDGLLPTALVLALFLPEMVKPGSGMHGLTQATHWLVHWLRQPLTLRWLERPSNKSLQLFGGLMLVFVGVLYQQNQAGAMSVDYAWAALKLLLQWVLLPLLVLVGVVRSPLFLPLEALCLRPTRPPHES